MNREYHVGKDHKLVASEFVSYGHPDKIADQVADAILDAFLEKDENVRAGIEVMVKDHVVVLGGEINSSATVDFDGIVRRVYANLDFPANHHLTPSEIKVVNLIGKQSEEIHRGVDTDEGIAAGDQGFMVGYASNETSVFMPLGHYMAKAICNYVAGRKDWGPDTKSQVIVEYDGDNKAVGIHSILVSTMHQCDLDGVREGVKGAIQKNLVGLDEKVYAAFIKDQNINIVVNPCGVWNIGGPVSDCGITGRKLVVDAYGGYCNIGGGNYSGKDFSKVDRSAAYMARYIAKNIVASGFCDKAKVTLAYMIGVAEPCSVEIEVNRNKERVGELKGWLLEHVDLTPNGIIDRMGGKYPQFYHTSREGHYGFDKSKEGNSLSRKWENLDLVDELKQLVSAM